MIYLYGFKIKNNFRVFFLKIYFVFKTNLKILSNVIIIQRLEWDGKERDYGLFQVKIYV